MTGVMEGAQAEQRQRLGFATPTAFKTCSHDWYDGYASSIGSSAQHSASNTAHSTPRTTDDLIHSDLKGDHERRQDWDNRRSPPMVNKLLPPGASAPGPWCHSFSVSVKFVASSHTRNILRLTKFHPMIMPWTSVHCLIPPHGIRYTTSWFDGRAINSSPYLVIMQRGSRSE